jgi:hypothetical protein
VQSRDVPVFSLADLKFVPQCSVSGFSSELQPVS